MKHRINFNARAARISAALHSNNPILIVRMYFARRSSTRAVLFCRTDTENSYVSPSPRYHELLSYFSRPLISRRILETWCAPVVVDMYRYADYGDTYHEAFIFHREGETRPKSLSTYLSSYSVTSDLRPFFLFCHQRSFIVD